MTEEMMQVDHWKTPKGKETLFVVFSSLVDIIERQRRTKHFYAIHFWDIVAQVHRKGFNYKPAYIVYALKELMRLWFVRRTKYMHFFVTDRGWEYWKKRQAISRGENPEIVILKDKIKQKERELKSIIKSMKDYKFESEFARTLFEEGKANIEKELHQLREQLKRYEEEIRK